MNQTIFEIQKSIDDLVYQCEQYAFENEGLIPDDLEEKIEALELSKDEKIRNIGMVIKNKLAQSDAIKAEIERLQYRSKTLDNTALRLKSVVAMFIGEGAKREFAEVSFGWRKSESVQVNDQSLIPPDYIVIKTTETPDKSTIKGALKQGISIPGCELIIKQNIQIK